MWFAFHCLLITYLTSCFVNWANLVDNIEVYLTRMNELNRKQEDLSTRNKRLPKPVRICFCLVRVNSNRGDSSSLEIDDPAWWNIYFSVKFTPGRWKITLDNLVSKRSNWNTSQPMGQNIKSWNSWINLNWMKQFTSFESFLNHPLGIISLQVVFHYRH